jgi:hypothetical protein
VKHQTRKQGANLSSAEHAGNDQAQAAKATGLLSFALLSAV